MMIDRFFGTLITRVCAVSLVLVVGACSQQQSPPSVVSDKLNSVSFDPPASTSSPVTTQELGQPSENTSNGKQIYLGKDQVAGLAGGRATAQSSVGGVEINFENAEISEVARVVLGEVLGVSYSIDPRIIGTVTIDSGGPLSERQLISVLESMLDMNGAALVPNGAGYKIVVSDEAQGPGQVLDLSGAVSEVNPGFGSTIIPLRYISASAAAQFARPLVHRTDDIQFDDNLNLLLVVGSTAERQNVVDTLRDLDVDWLAGKSVGIFPLAVTTPEAMIPELEVLFGSNNNAGDLGPSSPVEFIAMSRLNAVLAITAKPDQIVQVDRWISRLDRGQSAGMQFYVYTLKHLPAVDVARLLTESFGGITADPAQQQNAQARTRTLEPITFERDQFGLREQQFGDDSSIDADIAPLPPISDAPQSTGSSASIVSGVKIVANKANNSLLIRAAPQTYKTIEATLRRLDRAPLQVLIEATIVEVTLNDQLRYGVQYFLESGNVRAGFDNSNASTSAAADLINPLTRLPGFNFLFTPGSSRLLIDALSSLTDVQVLSSPTLVVQDNNSATLTVGDDVPITTRTAVGVQNADAPVVNNIEYRATGVTLRVTPRINSNEVVSLNVVQEVSRLSDPTDPGLTPIITQRRIDSSVNVQTGQTIVLGGLIQDTETRSRDQVPLLGDIPVLGELFGGTDNTSSRTELIVLIKPRIIRSAEDARDVSEELRARMRSFSPVRAKSRFQPWQQESNAQPEQQSDQIDDGANLAANPDSVPALQQNGTIIDENTDALKPTSHESDITPAAEVEEASVATFRSQPVSFQSSAPAEPSAETKLAKDPIVDVDPIMPNEDSITSAETMPSDVAADSAPLNAPSSTTETEINRDPDIQPILPRIRPIAGDTPQPIMRPVSL